MSKPVHTPGPVTWAEEYYSLYGLRETVMRGKDNGEDPATVEVSPSNVRLLAAAYNAFDSAAAKLKINAVEMAERLADGGLAELIEALDRLLKVCEHRPVHSSGELMAPMLSTQGAEARKALADGDAVLAKVKGGAHG